MLSCLSCVRSVFYVLGGLVELEPCEYNCGLRYLTVSCILTKIPGPLFLVKSCRAGGKLATGSILSLWP